MQLLKAPDSVQLKTTQRKMIFFIFWSTTKIKIHPFFFWLNLKRNFSVCQSFKGTKRSAACAAPLPESFAGAAREHRHRHAKKGTNVLTGSISRLNFCPVL